MLLLTYEQPGIPVASTLPTHQPSVITLAIHEISGLEFYLLPNFLFK